MKKILSHSRSKKVLLWSFLFIGIFGSLRLTFPEYSLFQDSHDKAIQIDSLIQNKFQSEELFYPGKRIDTNLEYYYLPSNLYVINKDRLVSAFPISFAILVSPFYWIFGIKNLPYFSVIISFITLILLRKYWRFDFLFLFLSFFATFAWPLSLDFSENTLIILLSLIPLILLFKGRPTFAKHCFAGLFLGLYVWFRLEGLIFAGSFLLFYSIGFLKKYLQTKGLKILTKPTFAFLTFLATVAIFLIFNWIDYGQILGTRYLANLKGFSVSWAVRIDWIKNLLFFGPLKIGYFGYLPLAILLFGILLFRFKKLSKTNFTLLGSSLLFLILVLLTTPNDGFNNWGPRFFASLIVPYCILIRKFWFYSIRKGKTRIKWIFVVCFVYSFLLGILGLVIQRERSLHVKRFESILSSVNADIWVYTDYLSFYTIGTHYLDRIVLKAENSEKVLEIIQKSSRAWPDKKIAFVQYDLEKIDFKTKEKIEKNSAGIEVVKPISWDQQLLLPRLRSELLNFQNLKIKEYEIWTGTLKR
ncbi:LA_3751/LA_3752 family putative glycosyltransferase [Leptospira yasudae]|uniref:Glycosyltransferase RgtA/B/C/D-like domain-containing protein n=1 Tax=Leptospira yasudae TaxID=2202201 RepID=A0A6N4QWA9_9LEPT|nr:hypothetical protein [Leptospira yasudae]TGL80650.1 hypothetical protein EHQ77_07990 [Leptospira yasudae]TGL80849.1 hypothetical protein EHQ72_06800 [Leptospira yasudae]TGL84240.1 hypothetical protein EHQ83_11160 [Leptospira yasudae]